MQELFNLTDEQMNILVPVLIVLGVITVIGGIIHYYALGTVIGLLALKFGLGVKVKGAATVGGAILKAGGKKAIAVTTFGVFFKRHIIDLFGKFFAEHSVGRYKKNIGILIKYKFGELKSSTPMKKAKTVLIFLSGGPVLYAFWVKFITTGVQKVLYAMLYPIFAVVWGFIAATFGHFTNFVSFLFQVLAMNWVITKLEKYPLGKKIIRGIDSIIGFLGDTLDQINRMFIYMGIDPKHYMIKYSIKLNRYLERIIDKKLNKFQKVKSRRLRHFTARERIISKRLTYKERRVKPQSLWKKTKGLFKTKVLKQKTYKEKRELRKQKKERK